MPYIEQIEEIIQWIETEKKILENEIRKLPDGQLRVCRRGDGLSYFLVDSDGRRHGIGRDKELITGLARKEFLAAKIQAAEKNSSVCRTLYERLSPDNDDVIIKTLKHGLSMIPEDCFFGGGNSVVPSPRPFNDMHIPIRQVAVMLNDMTPQEWAGARYQENTKYSEQKKHLGLNGLFFRSRAEMLISTIYEKNGWCYHYDERMATGNGVWISPDFQHCRQNYEMFFHEHCELDSDDGYDSYFSKKIALYLSAGIKPGKNLIITWSSRNGSLDLQRIERILKSYYE